MKRRRKTVLLIISIIVINLTEIGVKEFIFLNILNIESEVSLVHCGCLIQTE